MKRCRRPAPSRSGILPLRETASNRLNDLKALRLGNLRCIDPYRNSDCCLRLTELWRVQLRASCLGRAGEARPTELMRVYRARMS
jgi:hypothetical protein